MSNWEKYLSIVVFWFEERNYFVELNGTDNCICLVSKIIELDNNIKDLEVKTYIALHEAGHVLVSRSPGDLKLVKPECRNDITLCPKDKTRILLEEAEAWRRGYKLGMRLKIPVNQNRWEDEQTDALQKYMKWALKESK